MRWPGGGNAWPCDADASESGPASATIASRSRQRSAISASRAKLCCEIGVFAGLNEAEMPVRQGQHLVARHGAEHGNIRAGQSLQRRQRDAARCRRDSRSRRQCALPDHARQSRARPPRPTAPGRRHRAPAPPADENARRGLPSCRLDRAVRRCRRTDPSRLRSRKSRRSPLPGPQVRRAARAASPSYRD